MTSESLFRARIIASHGKLASCLLNGQNLDCEIASSFYQTQDKSLPTVGDYVYCDRNSNENGRAVILKLEERFSELSRKVAGNRLDKQVIAANIDTVYLLMSLNHDLNFPRLLRYVTIANQSGAQVEVVLTKADLMPEAIWLVDEIKTQTHIDKVHVISLVTGQGLEELKSSILPGQTIVLVGSSGVGKSSLTNALLKDQVMAIGGLRNDDKGRHTTSHRQMLELENGAWIIDTPGMREIQFLDSSEELHEVFDDIFSLSQSCKFSNCKHETEPGCQIIEALDQGKLSSLRYQEYTKYLREMAYIENKLKKKQGKKGK